MLATLTIDDRLDLELKKIAKQSNKPYQQVVNETLQRGLAATIRPKNKYKLRPSSLGELNPDLDLSKSLQLADQLEDDKFIRK